jgi:hypothetical protein
MSAGEGDRNGAADHLTNWGAFALYALGIAVVLPHAVIVRSDDFGYLESTISTIQQLRPVTGD